ncbi:MAG: hypothetical protein GF410_11145, partial [Chitinivibrionales bacterium]|nr:hypothetical protein [Chitinivibrionales bacterium]
MKGHAMQSTKPFLFVWLFAHFAIAGWNLPYQQPATYDYSSYYEDALATHVAANPDYFAQELATAWDYYKANYIMSNGLVNHMRLDPNTNQVIGTDHAVSEGQGYGMLLALLNNDQTTFNSIFEAANQYMWNTGSKSYYQWCWPGCGSGAATDADLDIGLALVFADKLQSEGLWQSYDQGGVTYHSRAMEIIRSIRNSMCTTDGYLLPGDSWGGDGINNLNPSYFATAWLKVFDEYQSEVSFDAVIDKCYSVLSNTGNYSKGQAPDWCNSSGGQTGKNYGMSNDGIRTPWRIAMDALWFNDARAKEFCYNSRNTITEYDNSDKRYQLAQMGLYESNGSTMIQQSNRCDAIAMWACGILGSQNIAYTTEGLNTFVIAAIVGTRDYMGDGGMSDHKFYFKQSIAMLGFAAIAGQFPNMLADSFEPADPVQLTTPLAASKQSVEVPTAVEITAALDQPASWTITLTGQTSGDTQTKQGASANIGVTWTGSGWYTVETVDVALSVAGLDPSTSDSDLRAAIEITKAPDAPQIEPGSSIVVHDLENASTLNPWAGAWFHFTDASNGGSSTVSPSDPEDLVKGNVGNPGNGIKATFATDQFAGVGMNFTEEGVSVDLTNFESITFDYKTEGG